MKKLLGLSITALLLSMSAAQAEDQTTIVTLYNSETTTEGTGSTLAVLRQVPRRAELFSCQERYTGSLQDGSAVVEFFNKGLSSVFKKRTNCLKYDVIAGSNLYIVKRKIANERGEAERYVYSQSGSYSYFSTIASDVATWTVDVNDGLGVPQNSDILLVGARVNHVNVENPTISSFRDSYKLAGMGQILYPTIEK